MTSRSEPEAGRRQLATIQYLRAASAVAIVLFHAGIHFHRTIHVGEARVALFFIVSGLVFGLITAGRPARPAEFLSRRAARLVPLYWVVTTLLWVRELTGFTHHLPATTAQYLLSILFVPHLDQAGHIFPVLVPGWTLVYEAFFCASFSALLLAPEARRLAAATVLYGGLGLIGCLLRPTGPLAFTYTNPILLEFLTGLWLAHLWPRLTLGPRSSWALLAAGLSLSFWRTPYDTGPMTLITAGVPSVMIILGALGLERSTKRPIAWLRLVGDGAYSIYLWHIPLLMITAGLLHAAHVDSAPISIAACTAVATLGGLAMYLLTEKPLTAALFARLDRFWAARRRPAPDRALAPVAARAGP